MTINVGTIDRILRFIIGALLIIVPLTGLFGIAPGTAVTVVSVVIGIVLIGTAFFRFCPLYRLLGMSTCPR